jgi:hypothetical protein
MEISLRPYNFNVFFVHETACLIEFTVGDEGSEVCTWQDKGVREIWVQTTSSRFRRAGEGGMLQCPNYESTGTSYHRMAGGTIVWGSNVTISGEPPRLVNKHDECSGYPIEHSGKRRDFRRGPHQECVFCYWRKHCMNNEAFVGSQNLGVDLSADTHQSRCARTASRAAIT